MAVPAYLREEGVSPQSNTETYVAVRAEIDTWRWAGVPFLLRHGKRLPSKFTEVQVQFRTPPLSLFNRPPGISRPEFRRLLKEHKLGRKPPNVLTLSIQPREAISLSFGVKRPGADMEMASAKLSFDYGEVFGEESAPAYERLLLDAMEGDATLFLRADEIEACWRFADAIRSAWRATTRRPCCRIRRAPGARPPPTRCSTAARAAGVPERRREAAAHVRGGPRPRGAGGGRGGGPAHAPYPSRGWRCPAARRRRRWVPSARRSGTAGVTCCSPTPTSAASPSTLPRATVGSCTARARCRTRTRPGTSCRCTSTASARTWRPCARRSRFAVASTTGWTWCCWGSGRTATWPRSFPGHAHAGSDTLIAHIEDSPKPPPWRVTLTHSALMRSTHNVVLAFGPSKRPALERALRGEPGLPTSGLPGLVFITDQELPS
ncbi:MAG: 6-phosphogluconolactonase [Sandaracinaceae bacterium]|nr:6-phosphogluconolactonase [Sandaracinaceae bacterium]